MDSKYDPGDEPDYCERHGMEFPCQECQRELEDDRLEYPRKENDNGQGKSLTSA
jgi:hypothetical protein